MEFSNGSLDFSMPLSGSGPRTASQTIVFPRAVTAATAGLVGYLTEFSGGNDHHVGQMDIRVETEINDNTVTVNGTFGLRDWSGNWDDQYDGNISFVVVAELESATAPPPRGDLIIEGAEFNQAVQFFRSSTYLDPAHQMPDNSIWLVANKDTGVRVYVDWDASAGLPPIANLTGALTVNTTSTTLHLTPTNPGGAITPRAGDEINMAIIDHTLNFMIPGAWCEETISVQCQVWDAAAPDSKSAAFTRTLTFTEVDPLNVFLVGVGNHPAGGSDLPAPTQSAVATTLTKLAKMYPVGEVNQIGYATLAFNETVTSTSPVTSGCGDGMNDLLDRLNDLRGGSSDIYLGTLPAGLVSSPGNTVGGCAPVGGNVAATFVDWAPDPTDDSDPAHEIGHCLGRRHAPCTGGRCHPAPSDVDPNYPQYGNFFSDSIGVFGFDPTDNVNGVKDPSQITDFMGYSPDDTWISAYTYNALRGSNFGPVGGAAPSGNRAHGRQGVISQMLFLGLTISRDRIVKRRPSFHYAAPGLDLCGCGKFTAELLDENRNTLICATLHSDCNRVGCKCWPKVTRDQIPFPLASRWLEVYEGEKKIYEEEIPAPPEIRIDSYEQQESGMLVKWSPADSAMSGCLWYVVHWYDERSDAWRGVAPRQQDTSLVIPRHLFAKQSSLPIRILATSGIATGVAQGRAALGGWQLSQPTVGLTGVSATVEQPAAIPGVIQAAVYDTSGRAADYSRAAWYGKGGAELSRGSSLDLRALPPGRQAVRFVAPLAEGGFAAGSWLVERTPGGFLLHSRIPEPAPKPPVADCGCEGHPHPHPHSATNS
ncbi:MAG TPA: hypothetical protein VMI94_19540 [Bryobacteraceae bacterium]|nr:hypothetical protein [Bryobacteraceae bacterium]